jgi:hypothetical protein
MMQFHRIPVIAAAVAATATVALSALPANASPTRSTQAVASDSPARPSLTYATNAWWVSGPYGATLRITPSGIAQNIGTPAAKGVMNNAIGIAGWPPYSQAVYNSMFEQLECHLFFEFKTPFDLDTWRPSVSWATELHDLCNPGYPHATL